MTDTGLKLPQGLNRNDFLYMKSLQKERNVHRNTLLQRYTPLLEEFLYLFSTIPFQTFQYRPSEHVVYTPQNLPFRIPYQLIGGRAVQSIQQASVLYGLGETPPLAPSPDLDFELNPLYEYTSSHKGSPPSVRIVPTFEDQRTPHPAYRVYARFVVEQLSQRLHTLLPSPSFTPLLPHLKPVDPTKDVEAIIEDTELSTNVGPFHISVIFNWKSKHFSKVLVLLNYDDEYEYCPNCDR